MMIGGFGMTGNPTHLLHALAETDIKDLREAIAATREKPVKRVLGNLLDGSENHLEAFTRALDQL